MIVKYVNQYADLNMIASGNIKAHPHVQAMPVDSISLFQTLLWQLY